MACSGQTSGAASAAPFPVRREPLVKVEVLFCKDGCSAESERIRDFVLPDFEPATYSVEGSEEQVLRAARDAVNDINCSIRQLVAYCPYVRNGGVIIVVRCVTLEGQGYSMALVRSVATSHLEGGASH